MTYVIVQEKYYGTALSRTYLQRTGVRDGRPLHCWVLRMEEAKHYTNRDAAQCRASKLQQWSTTGATGKRTYVVETHA